MNIAGIKAVVFDCDGVMFDTAQANRAYYNEVLKAYHKPLLTEPQFINVHMMTVKGAIEYLFPERKHLQDVFQSMKAIGYHKFIRYMEMEDGLVELLEALEKNGYIRGIGTNRTNTMEQVLIDFNLKSCFDIVVTAADVKHPKPAPDQLVLIMDRLGLNASDILFIGDSDFDCQAARAAGVGFVAFKNPELEADFTVNSMAEIAGILQIKQ